MQPITLGSQWKYVGKATGRGESHMVVALGQEAHAFKEAQDRIITLGRNSSGEVSHSWFGDPVQFWLEFTPEKKTQ